MWAYSEAFSCVVYSESCLLDPAGHLAGSQMTSAAGETSIHCACCNHITNPNARDEMKTCNTA
jgi:hypothetical protein